MKFTCLLAFAACCFSGCVSTSVPQVVIPDNGGEFDMSASVNVMGIQGQAQFAIISHLVVGGSYNLNFGPGPVTYGEGRLGAVFGRQSNMITAAYGRGTFDLNLKFPTGGLDSDNFPGYYTGEFHKLSLAWNHQFRAKNGRFGVLLCLAHYWGIEKFSFPHYGGHRDRPFEGPFRAEGLCYFRFGKDRNFLLAMGFSLGSFMQNGTATEAEPTFLPNPLLVLTGYNFSEGRKEGRKR